MAERFDWYQASFPGLDPDEFFGAYLGANADAVFLPTSGKNGYSFGCTVRLGDVDLIRANWGGNSDAPLNVAASGFQTMDFVDFSRREFPAHYLSRVDACIDFESPGAWDLLLDAALDVKARHRLGSREVGDWLDCGVKGRTFYLGSTKSDLQFRLYEKGKEQGIGGDWVRAELQLRPKKIVREFCATAHPSEVWGFSKWSRDLRLAFGASDVERMVREVVQKSAFERRFAAMMRQYGPTLRELDERLGSAELFLQAIRSGSLPSPSADKSGGSE